MKIRRGMLLWDENPLDKFRNLFRMVRGQLFQFPNGERGALGTSVSVCVCGGGGGGGGGGAQFNLRGGGHLFHLS